MKTIRQLAKEIRESLAHQHAYLNTQAQGRLRVYDAVGSATLRVKVIQNTPGALHHGRIRWYEVQRNESVTIFAGTAMEETLIVGFDAKGVRA